MLIDVVDAKSDVASPAYSALRSSRVGPAGAPQLRMELDCLYKDDRIR